MTNMTVTLSDEVAARIAPMLLRRLVISSV